MTGHCQNCRGWIPNQGTSYISNGQMCTCPQGSGFSYSSEYQEPKFSYPGMKTDAMIVDELKKRLEQKDAQIKELVEALENFKRWDEAVTNADHSFVELTEMRINALADMFDVLAKHKAATKEGGA